MPVRETSRQSYKKLTDLGDKQREVHELLKKHAAGLSDREMASLLGWEINQLLPRRGELEEYGFVKQNGKKYVKDTRRNVIVWVAADPIADRMVQKAVGAPADPPAPDPATKYLLKLKDGKSFTINLAMKQELDEAMKAKRGNRSVKFGGYEFRLSDIALPISEQGSAPAATPKPVREDYREVTLVKVDGQWQETSESESKLKRDRIEFRSQRIGKTTGTIVSDLMTVYDGIYESVRDMRGRDE